jgi:hypothetical protein
VPIYETVFRETVAYRFYVKAPNRKVVETWSRENTERLCNKNTKRQIVEERGWEELREATGVPASSLDAHIDADGWAWNNKSRSLPRKRVVEKKK